MSLLLREFNPSADSSDNRIDNEHRLVNSVTGFLVVPDGGLFYTKSMVVKFVATDTTAILNTDYTFQGFDSEITALTGYETAGAIALSDLGFTGTISLSYQAVGGKEGEISALVNDLRRRVENLSGGTINFADIVNRPLTWPPAPHSHSTLTDLSALEPLSAALNSIVASLTGNRIPVLSGTSLNFRIERLLVLLARIRTDVNNLTNTLLNKLNQPVFNIVSANANLTSSILGKITLFNSPSAINVYLPLTTDFNNDVILQFKNIGSSGVILMPQAGDVLFSPSGQGAIEFNSGNTLTLFSRGNVWHYFTGDAVLVNI